MGGCFSLAVSHICPDIRISMAEEQCPSPWTARRSNQSILKELSLEYSLEELMLKLEYFGHLMRRAKLIIKDPDAGKD